MKLLRDRPESQEVRRRWDTHCPMGDLSGRSSYADWAMASGSVIGSQAPQVGGQDGLTLELSGRRVRTGKTCGGVRTMIFSAAPLANYISPFMPLESGDLITPGSPPGAGLGINPSAVFLKPGDKMCPGIEGLGVQQQTVYAWDPAGMDG